MIYGLVHCVNPITGHSINHNFFKKIPGLAQQGYRVTIWMQWAEFANLPMFPYLKMQLMAECVLNV